MGATTPNQCFKHNLTELQELIELFTNSVSKSVENQYKLCRNLSKLQPLKKTIQ